MHKNFLFVKFFFWAAQAGAKERRGSEKKEEKTI